MPDVTNPGLVNVANQGDGPLVVDQPVIVGPTQVAGTTIRGGTYSPLSPPIADVTQNSVRGHTYGQGDPTNVFV